MKTVLPAGFKVTLFADRPGTKDRGYRDLTNEFSRLYPRLMTQQQRAPIVLNWEHIIECLKNASKSTQLAVVAQAQEMAAPRAHFAKIFQVPENANTQSSRSARFDRNANSDDANNKPSASPESTW